MAFLFTVINMAAAELRYSFRNFNKSVFIQIHEAIPSIPVSLFII